MPDQPVELPSEEMIHELVEQNDLPALRALLAEYHPADIADLLDELPGDDALVLFNLLNLETASEVLDETGSLVRQELVDKVDDERLADLLDELPMDDAAEFLDDLDDPTAERLLGLMEPTEADEVRALLSYEEDSAGRLMNTDVITLRRHWTVTEALKQLSTIEEPETLHYLYVVDRANHLIGVVPIRNFIFGLTRPHVTVESIMVPEVLSIPVTADQEELAEFISRYDFVAIPVVDSDNRLLGVVTVDDALDVLAEEATEDIQRLGGSAPLENPYFAVSVMNVVGKRLPWLMFLFIASLLSSTVIDQFQGILGTVVILASFIPLITGTGGNAGSQTVTTIIRAIAVEEVRISDVGRAWKREISVGLVLGLLLGLIGIVVGVISAYIQGAPLAVGLVIGITLPLVVVWANTVATVVPIMAERFHIDPTVISAPLITTVVDATALLFYFMIAGLILGL